MRRAIKAAVYEWQLAVFIERHSGERFPRYAAAYSYVRCWITRAACAITGHRFELSWSYFHADSAGESFECSRCGEPHDVTYY